MLISQPVASCLTNHSELCMSRPRNNQSRRISIYTVQRRPSFGFESSVSSTPLTSGDPVLRADVHPGPTSKLSVKHGRQRHRGCRPDASPAIFRQLGTISPKVCQNRWQIGGRTDARTVQPAFAVQARHREHGWSLTSLFSTNTAISETNEFTVYSLQFTASPTVRADVRPVPRGNRRYQTSPPGAPFAAVVCDDKVKQRRIHRRFRLVAQHGAHVVTANAIWPIV